MGFKIRSKLRGNPKSSQRVKLNSRKPWIKRHRPSKRIRMRVKKVLKNKTVRRTVLGTVAVGSALAMIPKDLLSKGAEVVKEQGENIIKIEEEATGNMRSLLNFTAQGLDSLSSGLGFLSENFTTVTAVLGAGFLAHKIF